MSSQCGLWTSGRASPRPFRMQMIMPTPQSPGRRATQDPRSLSSRTLWCTLRFGKCENLRGGVGKSTGGRSLEQRGGKGDQGSDVGWSLVADTADFESEEELEQKVPGPRYWERLLVTRGTACFPGLKDCYWDVWRPQFIAGTRLHNRIIFT